ncbi:SIS domain-containing protein [Arthrobacter sp. GMC3]|uniref:SIS domain-containing protein n=1 Tax=Arthrobacter sp. GMC3 TaxID=2058894 RepID=UPI000CE4839A|nr:sugar isomerase [Arthrobacter sp. GMC3]
MTTHRIDFHSARAAQPEALVRMADRVAAQLDRIQTDVAGWAAQGGPVFVGMGASYAAAALPVRILTEAGFPASREIASELLAAKEGVAVGISQSGRSPETLAAVGLWESSKRWSLTNIAENSLTASVPQGQAIDLGTEHDSYASTIGYTGTLVGLAMLASVIAGATTAQARAEWNGIDGHLRALEIQAEPIVAKLVDAALTSVGADVIGSGADRAATEAGALLLREVCRIPSSALTTRNYLHGEMESAGNTVHLVVGDDREIKLATTLAAAGHPTLLITECDIESNGALFVLRLPRTGSTAIRTVLATAVLQGVAEAFARARSVEIEEFVFWHDDTKIEVNG